MVTTSLTVLKTFDINDANAMLCKSDSIVKGLHLMKLLQKRIQSCIEYPLVVIDKMENHILLTIKFKITNADTTTKPFENGFEQRSTMVRETI